MKKLGFILGWIVAAGILAIIISNYIIKIQKVQTPLIEARIPQETIDFFNNLGGGDIGGIFVDDSITNWNDYEDVDGMCKIEDSLFVIYYSSVDSTSESVKAAIALRYAQEAVKPLNDFMGSYPYPHTINNRKLPIYLANTDADYSKICEELGHGKAPSGTIGLYCWRYSITGTITDGIIISPNAWLSLELTLKSTSDDIEFKKTLWHEMNHFAFFTNLDFLNNPVPPLWVSEGCAEYFADNRARIEMSPGNPKSIYRNCHLNSNEMTSYNSSYDPYWVGLSAFYTFEGHHGRTLLASLIQMSYIQPFAQSVSDILNSDNGLKVWDNEWHSDIEAGKY